jgi:uncharacterized protein with gpF-like domain
VVGRVIPIILATARSDFPLLFSEKEKQKTKPRKKEELQGSGVRVGKEEEKKSLKKKKKTKEKEINNSLKEKRKDMETSLEDLDWSVSHDNRSVRINLHSVDPFMKKAETTRKSPAPSRPRYVQVVYS